MMKKHTYCTGFLLMEALIGLFISTLLMGVFAYTVGSALNSVALARQRINACLLARSSLEYAFMTIEGHSGTYSVSKSGFSVQVTLAPDVSLKRLIRGTVSVTWPQGSIAMKTGRCL